MLQMRLFVCAILGKMCGLLSSRERCSAHAHGCRPLSRDAQDFAVQPTQFHAIFRRALPVVLRLACGPEPVARQLFEPLILSLVHWFTRAARRQAIQRKARHLFSSYHVVTSNHGSLEADLACGWAVYTC